MTRGLIVYALKRMAIAVPVLLVVSIIAFFLSTQAPGDIVEDVIALEQDMVPGTRTLVQREREYSIAARRLNRHLPSFYFQIQPASFPDTLHRILRKDERANWRGMLLRYRNWEAIQNYRRQVRDILVSASAVRNDSTGWSNRFAQDAEFLLISSSPERVTFLLDAMRYEVPDGATRWLEAVDTLERAYTRATVHSRSPHWLLPSFRWHGVQNQYHKWLAALIGGDPGISLVDGRPVGRKVREAVGWTLRLNVPVILLAFLIAIPLGVSTARREGSAYDKTTSALLFAFFAIPSFWLATLLVVFFTTPEYGAWTNLFPTSGIGDFRFATGLRRLGILVSHLFLPGLCLLLGTLAYLTRQMRGGMLRELRQDYIRMARAKGLTERKIHWHHALRNALFPMITLVGAAIPATISGSVIIEVIFGIPGMGRLLFDSILRQDWPVVFTMVLLASLLTVVGYLISDLLYRWVDPRVRLTGSR